MHKKLFVTCIAGAVCINAQANVIQYFTGISYSNPAELFKLKNNEFILGMTGFNTVARFQGRQLNFNSFQYDKGVSYSRTTTPLPYGRIANRYNEKWVFGVDVTQPFNSNLNWGNNSVTRYAATQTYLTDVDVSPRFSYSLSPSWFVGAGLNLNFLNNNEANWALPSGVTTSANMINKTFGFGLGFNAGVYHVINPSNFLGLAYFASIKQNTRGTSTFSNTDNTALQFDFRFPATTVLNYVHIFNPKWLTSLNVFFSEWDVNQYVNYYNTSAPPPLNQDFTFPMKFEQSLAVLAVVHYQYQDNLGFSAIGVVDDGPEQDLYRTVNFPSDKQYFVGLSADYHPTPQTTLEVVYGHGFSKTIINNFVNLDGQQLPFTTGRVKIHANVVDLKFKLQV